MKPKAILWTLPAKNDLVSVHDYIRLDNPEAARRFSGSIREAVSRLQDFPEMGSPLRGVPLQGEFRSIVVGNHRLIYRVDPKIIIIFRVWDCRQDPDKMWDELS